MSLIWIEGYDHEVGISDLQNGIFVPTLAPPGNSFGGSFSNITIQNSGSRWDAGSYVSVSNGPGGFQPGAFGFIAPFGTTRYTSGYFGSAIIISPGTTAYFCFYDIANSVQQININITSYGSWKLFRSGNSEPLVSGFISGFSVDWNYIELFTIIDSTNGAFGLKCNGAPIYNGTSLNTAATVDVFGNSISPTNGFSGIGCGNYNQVTGTVSFDDMYFNDTTGAAPYNTYLGDVRILTSKPNGAGTYTQFVALSGQNWQEVSESVVDGDASYNYSYTVGAKDTFTTNGGVLNSIIFGVQITNYSRKDDAINRQIANYSISSGTETQGNPKYMASSYFYNKDVYVNDPSTGSAWTYTAVNNLQIGYKLVS